MMEFRNLKAEEFGNIASCFNLAFSDYLIPVKAKTDQLYSRWIGARVDYGLSCGVFENGRLGGVVISGIDQWNKLLTAYNAATGVIPSMRGKGATAAMYEFLLPLFIENGIRQCTLEVIQRNDVAVHVYEKIGFRIKRALLCFGGRITSARIDDQGIEEKSWTSIDHETVSGMWDFQPSWENSLSALQSRSGLYHNLVLYKNDRPAAYAVVNIQTGYVPQFGVHPDFRRSGLGKHLFAILAEQNPVLVVNNVDSRSEATLNFLHHIGLKNTVNQYEMTMLI